MKKAISLLLALVMCLSLCACGGGNDTPETTEATTETTALETSPRSQDELVTTPQLDAFTIPQPKIGEYTLEQLNPNAESRIYGLYAKYPDNSFCQFFGGYPIDGEERYMTYGTDLYPQGLVISKESLIRNWGSLEVGKNSPLMENYPLGEVELVLFWPSSCGNMDPALFSIDETGYALSGWGDYGLLYADSNGSLYERTAYFTPRLRAANCYSVNGMPLDEFRQTAMFSQAQENGCEFASFDPETEYVLTEVDGTTLIKHECQADQRYFLYKESSETFAPVNYIPTEDGYAILDFTDTPPGEYIFQITSWSYEAERRFTYITAIVVNEDGSVIPYL